MTPNPSDAAASGVSLEIFGTERYPVFDVGTGVTHAFICFSIKLNSGVKEECFGFYPKDGKALKIHLSNGGNLTRTTEVDWIESPTSFRFRRESESYTQLILFDSSRNLYWQLPLEGGRSQVRTGADAWRDYLSVTDVDRDKGTGAFIGGPGMLVSEFQKNPTRFSNVKITFKQTVSDGQRRSIFVEMNKWNERDYKLTQDNCIDFVHDVAKYLGLKRPSRTVAQTPVEYVTALVKLNPKP